MRVKLLFIVGLGVGYVLGARAGRARYEQIKARATEVWENPRVQKVVTETQEFVKENAPIVQEKVVAGTRAAAAGAQDVAVRASEIAKDVTSKVADTTKDVTSKAADTTKEMSDRVVQSSREASRRARSASKKVAKAAKDASATVTKKAKVVRDKIVDRGEEVVDGVLIAAGTARDEALDLDTDDEK
ncbi:MAG: hypothetical protein ABI238_08220 [Terrimesophilobacter sp.]